MIDFEDREPAPRLSWQGRAFVYLAVVVVVAGTLGTVIGWVRWARSAL